MAILLTVFSILAAVGGYVSFGKVSQNIEEAKKARDDVLEEAKKARDDVLEEAKKARDDVLEEAKKARDDVLEEAKKARDDVLEEAKKARDDVLEEAKKARDDVLEEAKKARDDVLEEAKKARDDISRQMEEVKVLVMEIRWTRDVAREQLEKLNAESVSTNPGESARAAASVRGDPATPPIDRAIAAAVLLQRQGKIEEAIEQWRSIATVAGEEDRPLQARAWFSIGYLRSVGKGINLEAAVDAYTKAIELAPTIAAVSYNNRGSAKHDLGQSLAALADYDRAIELNPNYATAYNNRGNAKERLGQHDAAFADYDRAIELDPTFAIAYSNRGEMKHNLGRHEAALTDLDRAIELDPTLADAYNNRGNTKEILGRISEARADYQQALVLAQEARDEKLVAKVKDALHRLDNR